MCLCAGINSLANFHFIMAYRRYARRFRLRRGSRRVYRARRFGRSRRASFGTKFLRTHLNTVRAQDAKLPKSAILRMINAEVVKHIKK